MSLTATTLSGAVAAGATSLNVSSATGFAAGYFIFVDSEIYLQTGPAVGTTIPVIGGQMGTASVAHQSGAYAIVGPGLDFPVLPAPRIYTYGAAGALTPAAGLHRLIAASAAAMTLVAPTRDQEGQRMVIIAAAAQAYTVTLSSGYWNGTASNNVATWAGAIGDVLEIIALGGSWCVTLAKNVSLGT